MDIPVKVFKVAVTAMNGFLPKGEKIKTLKAKKEDILKQFEDVILAKIADGSAGDLPEECIDMYNEYLASAEEEEEEVDDVEEEEEEVVEKKTKGKKTTAKKTTPTKKTSEKKETGKVPEKNKRASSEAVTSRKEMIHALIKSGKHTKVEIVDEVSKKYTDVKPITIGTFVQDCMNEKYNKFDKLTIRGKDNKLSFQK